jgi:hypothetical protein
LHTIFCALCADQLSLAKTNDLNFAVTTTISRERSSKKNSEELINKITEHLKTFSTKTDDLDAVKIVAVWIIEEEKC